MDNELEVVEGMKLARGYISPYFITDHKTQKCVSSDCYCCFRFILQTGLNARIKSLVIRMYCCFLPPLSSLNVYILDFFPLSR